MGGTTAIGVVANTGSIIGVSAGTIGAGTGITGAGAAIDFQINNFRIHIQTEVAQG